MKKEHLFTALFLGLVMVSLYLFYRLLSPFLIPICWAAVLAIVFYPIYEKLEKRIRSSNLRALLVTALVVLLIIGPVAYLGVALVQEAASTFELFQAWVAEGNLDQLVDIKSSPMYQFIQTRLAPYVDLSQIDLNTIVDKWLREVSKTVLLQTTDILTNTGMFLFDFGLMVFFLFYLLRDGRKLFEQIRAIIPMAPEKTATTMTHLRQVVESTMYGGVMVALIQGVLGGILFLIMGLPSPVFWGAVMAFLAIIPFLGPFLIYIPAGLILIFSGSAVKGIILIVLGTVVVSQIDNFLRPVMISGKTGMHTMLLFISIMGGVGFLGLLGIVIGPVIAAFFVTLFDISRLKLAEAEGVESAPPPEGK